MVAEEAADLTIQVDRVVSEVAELGEDILRQETPQQLAQQIPVAEVVGIVLMPQHLQAALA
jgi:hypothetical protein